MATITGSMWLLVSDKSAFSPPPSLRCGHRLGHAAGNQATKGLLGVRRSVCQTWTLLMTLPPSQTPHRACNVSWNQLVDTRMVWDLQSEDLKHADRRISTIHICSDQPNCSVGKASAAFNKLSKIWNNKNLP